MEVSKTLRTIARVAIVPATAMSGVWMATTAHAATGVTVCATGCNYTTIAAAVASATSGEVISVRAGTYAGGFTVSMPLTIRGAGAGRTIISGGTSNSGTVVEVRANPVTISDVTITGGSWTSGSGLVGGGVVTDAGAVLNLSGSYVWKNQGNTASGGAGINSYGTTNVADSLISNNAAGTTADPGQGGGIHVGATGVVNMSFSIVWANTAAWGGGMDIDAGGAVTLADALLAGNTASHQGGGIDDNGTLSISRSLLLENSANQAGGLMDNGSVTIDSSLIELNSASGGLGAGGGIYQVHGAGLTLHFTAVVHNTPDNLVAV